MQLLPLVLDKSFLELSQSSSCFNWVNYYYWSIWPVMPPDRIPMVPELGTWIMFALGLVVIALWKLRDKSTARA